VSNRIAGGVPLGWMQVVSCCFVGAVVVFDFGVGEVDFVYWVCCICCAGGWA
jgi:hypothetical protein